MLLATNPGVISCRSVSVALSRIFVMKALHTLGRGRSIADHRSSASSRSRGDVFFKSRTIQISSGKHVRISLTTQIPPGKCDADDATTVIHTWYRSGI